ncbi:MAG: aldo/keto reductase [Clostridia bacterium]|nr:aldo/keto reductase [Clostridia bacterium]
MKQVGFVLGTMTFGESVFEPDVALFIDTFLEAGYRELDTAYVYNDGTCEQMLGEILQHEDRPYRISTKVNPRITGKLDGAAASMQLHESLRRLKRDSVDTVYLHFPDPATPVISVLETMAELHCQGKFCELGLSNFPAWMVADIWHICDRNGWVKPTVYEGIYNPLTRKAETELRACLNQFGIRFYAYNPLAGGLLTGRYEAFEEKPSDGRFTHRPNYQQRYWKKSFFQAIEFIKGETDRFTISLPEATYRWLAFHSMLDGERGDAVIIGASKQAHLIQNMETVRSGPLPKEIVDAFEMAWSMTKGDSPEYFTLYTGKGSVGGEKK